MIKHMKVDVFLEKKIPTNMKIVYIASTFSLQNHPFNDQTVQSDEQPFKIQKVVVGRFDVTPQSIPKFENIH